MSPADRQGRRGTTLLMTLDTVSWIILISIGLFVIYALLMNWAIDRDERRKK